MAEPDAPIAGGCRCGAVRYEASGETVYNLYCHCESCRRATGGPVVAYLMYKEGQVQFIRGKRKVYDSSPGVRRTFCGDCGTPLTWEGVWGGRSVIEVFISTLDDPNAFAPDRHVFHGEKIRWFDVADQLPRYRGSSTDAEPDSFEPDVDMIAE